MTSCEKSQEITEREDQRQVCYGEANLTHQILMKNLLVLSDDWIELMIDPGN